MGEGRYLARAPPEIAMHSDATEVGYGGNLGYQEKQGLKVVWEFRGFLGRDRSSAIDCFEGTPGGSPAITKIFCRDFRTVKSPSFDVPRR